MTDLRKTAEDLLEGVEAAIKAGDWKVDGACDPDSAIIRLRQALAQPVDAVNMSQERVDETAKREQEPVAFVTGYFGGHLTISCFDPALVLPDGLALYTAPLKRNCDNCESLRKAAWDRIKELEAKLEERENNVLFNDVLKSFKLYAESLGVKLKEKNT